MLAFMRGLGIIATSTVSAVVVFFIALWDLRGKAGQAYREAMSAVVYAPSALIMAAISLVVALLLPVLVRLDPRTHDQAMILRRGPKFYAYRRSYRGGHHLVTEHALAC